MEDIPSCADCDNTYFVGNCRECKKYLCEYCANVDQNDIHCMDCFVTNPRMAEIISDKIASHMLFDSTKFIPTGNITVGDVMELFIKQNFRCYICECRLLINSSAYCFYKFSIDRIDNKQAHNKNNVLIACYHCNCGEMLMKRPRSIATKRRKIKFKICVNKCHTNKTMNTTRSEFYKKTESRKKIKALQL